jgi:hypothetical protein
MEVAEGSPPISLAGRHGSPPWAFYLCTQRSLTAVRAAYRLSALNRPVQEYLPRLSNEPYRMRLPRPSRRHARGILAADRGCVLQSNVAILWFCHAQFSNMKGIYATPNTPHFSAPNFEISCAGVKTMIDRAGGRDGIVRRGTMHFVHSRAPPRQAWYPIAPHSEKRRNQVPSVLASLRRIGLVA